MQTLVTALLGFSLAFLLLVGVTIWDNPPYQDASDFNDAVVARGRVTDIRYGACRSCYWFISRDRGARVTYAGHAKWFEVYDPVHKGDTIEIAYNKGNKNDAGVIDKAQKKRYLNGLALMLVADAAFFCVFFIFLWIFRKRFGLENGNGD